MKQQVKLVGLDKVLKPSLSSLQIPVVMELSQKNNLDIKPLVWALAMGSCLGGEAHMQNLLLHHAGSCTTLAAENELISLFGLFVLSDRVACELRLLFHAARKYGNQSSLSG